MAALLPLGRCLNCRGELDDNSVGLVLDRGDDRIVLGNFCDKCLDIGAGDKQKVVLERDKLGVHFTYEFGDRLLDFIVKQRPTIPTLGVTSECTEPLDDIAIPHISMLDYDNIMERKMFRELRHIVLRKRIAPYYVLTTRRQKWRGEYYGNYICWSITKISFAEQLDIINSSHSDYLYKKVPPESRFKYWVSRIAPKAEIPRPDFLTVIPKDRNEWFLDKEVSKAHLEHILRLFSGLPNIVYPNIDNSTMTMESYLTANV